MTTKAPTLRFERSFVEAGHRLVAGADEVGRGALAGPVSVGMVAIDATSAKQIRGVRDSKLLSPADRVALVPKIQKWALAYGVGHASAAEIDALGLMAAMRLAGARAWGQVLATARPDIVILDGNHDWLSAGEPSLFDDAAQPGCDAPVLTRIKADLQCLSVAAASVLAKVERDAMMMRSRPTIRSTPGRSTRATPPPRTAPRCWVLARPSAPPELAADPEQPLMPAVDIAN